jgi:hypothetical protein
VGHLPGASYLSGDAAANLRQGGQEPGHGFHRDKLLNPQIHRQVHFAHASTAQHSLDPKPVEQHLAGLKHGHYFVIKVVRKMISRRFQVVSPQALGCCSEIGIGFRGQQRCRVRGREQALKQVA